MDSSEETFSIKINYKRRRGNKKCVVATLNGTLSDIHSWGIKRHSPKTEHTQALRREVGARGNTSVSGVMFTPACTRMFSMCG